MKQEMMEQLGHMEKRVKLVLLEYKVQLDKVVSMEKWVQEV